MITNKVDELGGKAKRGSVRIKAWTRLENNQETSWHLSRTVSHPTSKHSQKPCQKHIKVQLTLVNLLLLYIFFRDSIAVHTKTHADGLWFDISGAEETRCREAAYSDEPTSKMDHKLPGKERKFTARQKSPSLFLSSELFGRRGGEYPRPEPWISPAVECELLSKVLNDRAKESHTPLCSNWTMCHGLTVIPAFKQQRLDHVLQKPQTMK